MPQKNSARSARKVTISKFLPNCVCLVVFFYIKFNGFKVHGFWHFCYVCLCVCLFVCLFVRFVYCARNILFDCPFVCIIGLLICLFVCLSVLFVCLSVYLYVCLLKCFSVILFICLSCRMCTCSVIFLSVGPFVCLFMIVCYCSLCPSLLLFCIMFAYLSVCLFIVVCVFVVIL